MVFLTGDRSPSLGWRHALTRMAERATTPLLPRDYLDLFAPLRAGADLRGRILEVIPETRDAATLVIQPGADWAGHVPGQYLRIGVEVDGVRQWRAYSLTHGPRPDGLISITVKAVADGKVSPYLVHATRPGTLVHLEQAAGEFVLPPAPAKLLFVTAGSGITPVIGMLRNLYPVTDSGVLLPAPDTLPNPPNRTPNRDSVFAEPRLGARPTAASSYDIVVVHVAPSRPDSIFLRDLESLQDAGAIRLVARYDDQHGVLDIDDLSTLVPDLDQRTTLACGPAGLLDALGDHHADRELELLVEQFRTSRVEAGDGGTVTYSGSGTTVEADGATSLLDAGEAAGVLMPSGCRMGVCFGCVLPLKEGTVRDLRNGDLTTAIAGESGAVPIQTCINAAAGRCELDV